MLNIITVKKQEVIYKDLFLGGLYLDSSDKKEEKKKKKRCFGCLGCFGIILLLGLIGSCIGIFANTDDETDQDSKNKNIIEEPEEKPLDEEKKPVENESEAEPDQQEEIIEPEPKPEPETETEEILNQTQNLLKNQKRQLYIKTVLR